MSEQTVSPVREHRPRPAPTTPTPIPRSSTTRRSTNQWQRWMRWMHVYASMIAFLVILFFGITGILLNHPTWLFGDDVTVTTIEGTLPDTVRADDGGVEFLAASEFVRSEHGVTGEVTNFDELAGEGSINYSGPGYGATFRFDVDSLTYELTEREEGLVNAMRDLHSGSDTGSTWSLVIDVAAVFLVVVAVSGLAIQLLMRKRRRNAVAWLSAGSLVTAVLIWLTMA